MPVDSLSKYRRSVMSIIWDGATSFAYLIDQCLICFVFFLCFFSRSQTACNCSNPQQPRLAQLCQKSVDKFKLSFRIFVDTDDVINVDNISDLVEGRSVVISLIQVVIVVERRTNLPRVENRSLFCVCFVSTFT